MYLYLNTFVFKSIWIWVIQEYFYLNTFQCICGYFQKQDRQGGSYRAHFGKWMRVARYKLLFLHDSWIIPVVYQVSKQEHVVSPLVARGHHKSSLQPARPSLLEDVLNEKKLVISLLRSLCRCYIVWIKDGCNTYIRNSILSILYMMYCRNKRTLPAGNGQVTTILTCPH